MRNSIAVVMTVCLVAIPLYVARADTQGQIENIAYVAESEKSAKLAEEIANLILAYGMGKPFESIFIVDNKDDKDLSPIMILKLSENGDSIQIRGNEKLNKLMDDITFLMARHYKGQEVFVYLQNSRHENLLEVGYGPGEKKVSKKLMEKSE